MGTKPKRCLVTGIIAGRLQPAYYPLADVYTNSARIYSYLDEGGKLLEADPAR